MNSRDLKSWPVVAYGADGKRYEFIYVGQGHSIPISNDMITLEPLGLLEGYTCYVRKPVPTDHDTYTLTYPFSTVLYGVCDADNFYLNEYPNY